MNCKTLFTLISDNDDVPIEGIYGYGVMGNNLLLFMTASDVCDDVVDLHESVTSSHELGATLVRHNLGKDSSVHIISGEEYEVYASLSSDSLLFRSFKYIHPYNVREKYYDNGEFHIVTTEGITFHIELRYADTETSAVCWNTPVGAELLVYEHNNVFALINRDSYKEVRI